MDLFKAKSRHWCTVSKSANTKDTSRTGALYEGLNPQSSTSADAHSWEVHGLVAGKPPFTTGGRGSGAVDKELWMNDTTSAESRKFWSARRILASIACAPWAYFAWSG